MANVLECQIVRINTPVSLQQTTKFESASPKGTQITVSDYCGFAHTRTFIPDYVQLVAGENAVVLTDSVAILTDMVVFTKLIQRLTLVDYNPFDEFTIINVNGVEFEDAHEYILNSAPVKAIVTSIIDERSKVTF